MTAIDTGTDDLLAEVNDGVAVLTMNRPERRNAFSGAMIQALGRVLADVEVDDDVGCVVLTGAGGAFCAGGDVKGMASGGNGGAGRAGDVRRRRPSPAAQPAGDQPALYEMPKPTIAALPGRGGRRRAVAGAGLRPALRRPGAVLTTAFAKVGFAGDYGGTWFLTRLVGSGKARELYYFSDRLSAEEAERLGIVNGVFPAETSRPRSWRARQLAAGPRSRTGT